MILLVGPSASGKTEAAKCLRSRYGIVKVVTHTTRAPREGERDGVDYHYVSKEEFLKLKAEDAFVETTEYSGNYYGCSKAEIGESKCVVVDPNGLKSFLALNDNRIVTFYLRAKEDTRRERMRARHDEESLIKQRIENDRKTFIGIEELTDYAITTDRRPLVDIVSEIYERYLVESKNRGIKILIQ